MAGRKKIVEKRKNKRYKAVEGSYAAISPNSCKLGQIIDISMGGIRFKYIDISDVNKNTRTQQEKSIFLSSIDYYVGDLTFRTVSDYGITYVSTFNSINLRKRHVQFKDLTFKQLFDLDYYIRNNVSEEVENLLQQNKLKTL
jgi:hypothetical protein